jgi:hypothetical protein
MQHPPAIPALLANRLLNHLPLTDREHNAPLLHEARSDSSEGFIDASDITAIIHPATLITGQP